MHGTAKTPSYPGLSRKAGDFLSGAILDPETLVQKSSNNGGSECFPEVLMKSGIIPGVKPHLKVYTLPGTGGDTVMQGLGMMKSCAFFTSSHNCKDFFDAFLPLFSITDSLASRLNTYYQQGARFTKWRAPLEVDISEGKPTRFAIEANMKDLARCVENYLYLISNV